MTSFSLLLLLIFLQQSGIKEKFGVTLAMIERGGCRILAPTRDEKILPTDIFVNKSIRNCGLRESVNGLIVGDRELIRALRS